MSLFSSLRRGAPSDRDAHAPTGATVTPGGQVCLQCGMMAASADIAFCRRCGLSIGAAPRANAELPTCPICYATVGDDGRLPSLQSAGRRLDLVAHMSEHDRYPVGDDDYLESLRFGDMIRIDRWQAPFELVRRYLVTGAIDGGRRRSYQHSAIVTAMSQIRRWGHEAEIFGDQEEWREARDAVSALMERYQRSGHAGH
jgi:Zn-finger nucleic acid-binding protein